MFESKNQIPPFRADTIGSLLRPRVLRDAFRSFGGDRESDSDFIAIQNEAIRDVIKLQEDIGLQVVNDGEFRRSSYWGRFVERCEGFSIRPAVFKFRDDHGHETDFTATYAEGPLRRARPLATDEFSFVHATARVAGKITVPAPSTMHFYRCTDYANTDVYPDVESFFSDLCKIYQAEIADLAGLGCRYVQFDEVAVAMLCDPAIREKVASEGQDPATLISLYIQALNDCIAAAPSGMSIGIHMCRGNFRGRHLSEGGYDAIAEQFFSEVKATHFLLEYDTPRAGDFKPLRFLPKNKGAVLGLVSSKNPALEKLGDLQAGVESAARYVEMSQLGISPQCGFASTAAGNPVTEEDQRAKLALVVEAASVIWR